MSYINYISVKLREKAKTCKEAQDVMTVDMSI